MLTVGPCEILFFPSFFFIFFTFVFPSKAGRLPEDLYTANILLFCQSTVRVDAAELVLAWDIGNKNTRSMGEETPSIE